MVARGISELRVGNLQWDDGRIEELVHSQNATTDLRTAILSKMVRVPPELRYSLSDSNIEFTEYVAACAKTICVAPALDHPIDLDDGLGVSKAS